MRNAALGTIAVQKVTPGNTQPRLEGTRFVVDAGVNDFAVARTHVHAEVALAFENDHFAAAARQRPGRRKAYDPCTDDNAIDVVQRV